MGTNRDEEPPEISQASTHFVQTLTGWHSSRFEKYETKRADLKTLTTSWDISTWRGSISTLELKGSQPGNLNYPDKTGESHFNKSSASAQPSGTQHRSSPTSGSLAAAEVVCSPFTTHGRDHIRVGDVVGAYATESTSSCSVLTIRFKSSSTKIASGPSGERAVYGDS